MDFKQKCTYNIDEQLPSNEITYGNYTKTPLWSFRAVKSEQIGRHPLVTICAENTRCTGCFNIVSGVKYDHHQFVYFGSGADQEQLDREMFALPDMCECPWDIREEPEVAPEMQRLEQEVIKAKQLAAEEAKRAAEETEEKSEQEADPDAPEVQQ